MLLIINILYTQEKNKKIVNHLQDRLLGLKVIQLEHPNCWKQKVPALMATWKTSVKINKKNQIGFQMAHQKYTDGRQRGKNKIK